MNMKLFTVLLVSCSSVSLFADSVIVTVDISRLADTALFKERQAAVQAKIQEKAAPVEELQNKLQANMTKLQTGGKDMKPEMREKLQEETAALNAQFEMQRRNFEAKATQIHQNS